MICGACLEPVAYYTMTRGGLYFHVGTGQWRGADGHDANTFHLPASATEIRDYLVPLTTTQRWEVAEMYRTNQDQPGFNWYSALAAWGSVQDD